MGGGMFNLRRAKAWVVLLCLVGAQLAAPAYAGTTGAVRGTVTEKETGKPMGGVTVVATSPALQGEEAALTDTEGRYRLINLPPGVYKVMFIFVDTTIERTKVEVNVDKTVSLDAAIPTSGAAGESYVIEEEAPAIDVATSTNGIILKKEFIQNTPIGRTRNFEEAMNVLPSASNDEFGVSVGGSTSPENSYVIDGLNTTDPALGLLGSRLVLEFVEQFELKEGGYGAEFGRSTGGFMNVVTKSGGNEFHGSAFVYYRPGFLQGNTKQVFRAGESLARQSQLDYYMNAGFELGGPIIKDKLWFHVGYAPEIQSINWKRVFLARTLNAAGDGVIRDADGIPVTSPVGHETYSSRGVVHQFTTKLTHEIAQGHRHSLTVRGAPTTFDGAVTNPFDPNSPSLSVNGDPDTFKFTQFSGNVDGIYKYTGEMLNKKLQTEAWLGWHHQRSYYNPTNGTVGQTPMRSWNMDRTLFAASAESRGLPQECMGDGLTLADTSRCVVQNYTSQGFGSGMLQDSTLDRYTQKAAITGNFDGAGLHQTKLGIDFEQNTFKDTRTYTGGGSFTYRPGPGYFRWREFYANDANATDAQRAQAAPSLSSDTASYNYAVFLQDSWNPDKNQRLTINYGLRWEAQEFYGVKMHDGRVVSRTEQQKAFGIYDNIAPRVGFVWDFLGNGKSRFFGHWGKYYQSVPLDMTNRSFGGESQRMRYYSDGSKVQPGQDAATPCTSDGTPTGTVLDPTQVTDPRTQCTQYKVSTLGSDGALVSPGIKGQYIQEYILGTEVEWKKWVMGVTGIHRGIGRVIEDVSTDGGNTYMFANPGSFDESQLDKLSERIARETNDYERARMILLRDQSKAINTFPKPKRDYYALQFQVSRRFNENFFVRGSYLLSTTRGNYPGLFSDNNGQLDPNLTSQYDLVELLDNRNGPLPGDHRHRLKADGFYQYSFKKIPVGIVIGGSVRVQSGAPIDVLGAHMVYGNNEVFILPRGGMGDRTPWIWSLDAHFGVKYRLSHGFTAEVFADIFNFTNNRGTLSVDQTYTYDSVQSIIGGTKEDLLHARNVEGTPVKRNRNFGKPTSFQAPIGGQFGARLMF